MQLKKALRLGAFFIASVFSSSLWAACPAPDGGVEVRVKHVIDGDTIRLMDGRSVRLIGIDTPEIGRQGKPSEPFAQAARTRLSALLSANDDRVVLVDGVERHDRYGRTLAHLYDSEGLNLAEVLLREGYGRMIAIAPNTRLAQCHLAAERIARSARLRLWSEGSAVEPDGIVRGGFTLVHARVKRVQRNKGGVWLELHGPLVLKVAPELVGKFDESHLETLVGQRVEARGWVVDRKNRRGQEDHARWMLSLTDPSMIRLLE
jgi:endonuclease YncB( thermonuclease family)